MANNLPAVRNPGQMMVLTSREIKKIKQSEQEAAKAAYESMNEALRAATDKVHEQLRSVSANLVSRIWRLGQFLREIDENEAKYDEGALAKIEKTLTDAHSRSMLTKALQFNRCFTEQQLNSLLEMRMAISGQGLKFQHFEKLITVKDPKQREKLAKEVVDNDLTPEELQLKLLSMRDGGKDSKNKGGRKVKIPTTPNACVIRSTKIARAVIRDADAIFLHNDYGFESLAKNMPVDKIKPETVELLKEAIDTYREAEDVCRSIRLAADNALRLINDRLEAQAKKEAAIDAEIIASKTEKVKSEKKIKTKALAAAE
jgi:hypothetical protein